jgi:hypothetical protein
VHWEEAGVRCDVDVADVKYLHLDERQLKPLCTNHHKLSDVPNLTKLGGAAQLVVSSQARQRLSQ